MSVGVARSAVVTGAAQGLGRVTACLLAEQGHRLLLLDLQDCDATLAALHAAGHEAIALRGDVAEETFAAQAARTAIDAFGGVDLLVNNAGISQIIPAEDISAAEWRRVMDVNLLGPFLLCREFGRQMLARGCGSIVNVASVAGLRAVAHRSAYNASKHGLIGLTRTLA
ncbi:MAG: SDR family oxidoreductase, partial [Gammaproteobacteria bacterium]|nr:SDR family oxidoreductase [Gammaproteobacteria bacterium]